jgi:hypothetical protein
MSGFFIRFGFASLGLLEVYFQIRTLPLFYLRFKWFLGMVFLIEFWWLLTGIGRRLQKKPSSRFQIRVIVP